MLPVVGASIPVDRLIKVVLPVRFGPTSPATWPAGIVSVQSARAQRWP